MFNNITNMERFCQVFFSIIFKMLANGQKTAKNSKKLEILFANLIYTLSYYVSLFGTIIKNSC